MDVILMSKIKNVNIQLDHNKKREKKIIDLLESTKKEDGISHKEYIMSALENRNDILLGELQEIKQLLLLFTSSPQKPALQKNHIKKISALDDEISKDDINF